MVAIGCRPDQQRILPFSSNYPKDSRFLKALDSVNDIPTPLKPNSIWFVKNEYGTGFYTYLVDEYGNLIIQNTIYSRNITVSEITEGAIIEHGLNSTKIEVSFYLSNGNEVKENSFSIIDENNIEIYLPILESGASTFSGDIFVKRRDLGVTNAINNFSNPNVLIDINNKGEGDIIMHPYSTIRIVTFYNSDDGDRQMNDFYATSIVNGQFTLKNDFTSDKFNGQLLCVQY